MEILFTFLLAVFIFLFLVWEARRFTRRVEEKFPPVGHFVWVEGYRLHYIEKGAGDPLVLLHGDGGSVYDWLMSPLLDKLAECYRVIAFDRPGLGYSQRPADGWSPLVQARLIHTALHLLGVEKPMLVGHSRGGTVLLAYLIQYPQTVRAAVGLAPGGYTGSLSRLRIFLVPILGDVLLYALAIPLARRRRFAMHRDNLNRFAFAPDRQVPEDYLEVYASLMTRPAHARAYLADLSRGGPITDLMVPHYKKITVPLIIVQGTADRNVSLALSERLHQDIPGSRLIALPGTGHELQFNRPDEVIQAIDLAWQVTSQPVEMPVSQKV